MKKILFSAIAILAMSASFAHAAEVKPISKPIESILVADSKANAYTDVVKQVAKTSADSKALAVDRSDVLTAEDAQVSKTLTEAIAQLIAPSIYHSAALSNRSHAEKSFIEAIKNTKLEAAPTPQHDENLN